MSKLRDCDLLAVGLALGGVLVLLLLSVLWPDESIR